MLRFLLLRPIAVCAMVYGVEQAVGSSTGLLSLHSCVANNWLRKRVFWFALAAGTVGGLLFSLIGVFFVGPVLMAIKKISR